ncbi:MAG TPA: tetratricopeptide repeat protein [Terriglobia bacterium]
MRCSFRLVPALVCLALSLASLEAEQKALPPGKPGDYSAPQQAARGPSASSAEVKQLFDAASGLIKQSRYADAAKILRQAETLAPNEPTIHHYLGYALWKQDQWSAAEAEFQKANRLDPTNPYTLYFLARIAQSSGQPGESIRRYQAIVRLGPAIYDTNQRLGQLYLDQGNLEKSRQSIEAALKETPWDSALYYQLGKIDQKTGHADAAQEEFASAERLKNISQIAIQHLLALDQAARDQKNAQVDELRAQLLAEASQDPEILQSAGVLLGRAGLYEQAREPLERSLKLDTHSFEATYNLGLTLLQLHLDQDAEASFLAALKLQPNSLETNRALAVLYVDENRNLDAIERLRAADQLSPGDPKILSLLGQQYLQGYFVKEAIATLQQAVQLSPQDPNVRFLLVEAYHAAQDYEQALQAAQATMRLFPDSGRACYEAAQELAALGRNDDAHAYAKLAVQKEPPLVEAWNLLGDIDSKSGQYDLALKDFGQAQSLDASNAEAARGVTENLIHLQRYDQALADLQQAISAHPQDPRLYFNLVQVYTRTGKREEASRAATIYQRLHAEEVAQHDAQVPRTYTPPAKTGGPGE